MSAGGQSQRAMAVARREAEQLHDGRDGHQHARDPYGLTYGVCPLQHHDQRVVHREAAKAGGVHAAVRAHDVSELAGADHMLIRH